MFQKKFLILFLFFFSSLCIYASTKLGAEQTARYLPMLEGKRVALVVNQTSQIASIHLLDTLLSLNVDVKKVFAPEHGFRGDADAGAEINSSFDSKTALPLVSIYGKNKKPTKEQLQDVDVLIFDIQDVGARFYTYISSMHYIMEACAEYGKLLIILDRPNPNDYVDGPILKRNFQSFVGIDPIPVLHGCTVGELARMINGERWLLNGLKCDLKVIEMQDWKHGQAYSLPVKPSPNLPNDRAIQLYPSLCLFEGTDVSMGRGTEYPFQMIGYPDKRYGEFEFTPLSILGMDSNPVHKDKVCYGLDLRQDDSTRGFCLSYLILFYQKSVMGAAFFNRPAFFDKLAGTDKLRKQIIAGKSEYEIRKSWDKELSEYKKMRKKYLLYPE